MADTERALAGVRILDLSRGLGGALAGMLLADLGAEVLHARTVTHDPYAEPGFVCWDRNKTLTRLDVTDADDRTELARLAEHADAVVVDWSATELEALGLDADHLRDRAPGLVHVHAPGYGARGRWVDLPPDPYLLAAVSGVADNFAATEDRPVLPVVPLISYEQGAMTAAMTVAALLQARRTASGQAVTVTGLHGVAAMLAAIFVEVPGVVRTGKGSSRPGIPHFRHYQCGDGRWLFLAALAQPFFLRALEAMDAMDVMVVPGIDGEWLNLQRSDLNAAAHDRLETRFAEKTRDEWLEILSADDVPCAPVSTRDEWSASETVAANDLRVRLDHAELGAVELPGVAVTLSLGDYSVRHLGDSDHEMAATECWTEPRPRRPPPSGSARDAGDGPLAGLRVLDLASFVAGTFGPSILASLGADVVKIETSIGDPYRDFSASFAAYNQAKRGVGLDVKHPDGYETFLALVRDADVVVDGVRPSVRPRLGVDFDTLHRVNPRLVRCSVTGWGDAGPLAETPAFDPLLQSRSGLMVAQGGDGPPVYVSMLVHDVGSGTLAALGILAALYQRETTGEGQEVKVSLASSSVCYQSGELTQFEGRAPASIGGVNWAGPRAVERLYRCRDGWIMVAATEVDTQRALATFAQVAVDEPRAEPADGALAQALDAAFARLDVDAADAQLRAAGVPAAVVLERGAVFTDEWLSENQFFRHFEQPGLGPLTGVAGYSEWRDASSHYDAPAPRNGEHTRDVLREAGLEPAHIDALLAVGAAHELRLDT